VKSNCLETTHPNLAGEWHPDKNWPLTPSDVFAGSVKKFWWKCPVGGHEWLATVAYRSKGSGCPICRESKGEKLIASVLTEMGYPFERQVRFDGCKSEQRLFFDFLVWLSDGAYVLIEYNGQQHYEPQRWGSSMSDEKIEGRFEEAQKRDQIKEQWAKDNGVSLLVIPYWDIDKIETLIEEFISQHTGVLDHEEATEAHQDGLQPQA
jgi:hypothetical protein